MFVHAVMVAICVVAVAFYLAFLVGLQGVPASRDWPLGASAAGAGKTPPWRNFRSGANQHVGLRENGFLWRRSSMLKGTNAVWFIAAISVSVMICSLLGIAVAQKTATPKPQDKLALAEPEVKQLLLVMDTDKSGKISKQEWMRFMEAEFDRLDKDKKGQLNANELTQSKVRVSHPVSVGK
jgi:EF hand domain-containing protein